MQTKIVIARMMHALRSRRRGMFVALAIMVVVQTALPAHQDTHPIGSLHVHCEYCVLAGHALGVPGMAILVPPAPVYAENQVPKHSEVYVQPYPRTLFSRGPPVNPII